ncbi:hypothetical protein KC328_g15734 [Hortaea werneckii]|nr:hypothetical protein KC328_g15734 [Hortaea werneckii]
MGTQLPVTGGIVKRPPYELLHKANGAPSELITAAAYPFAAFRDTIDSIAMSSEQGASKFRRGDMLYDSRP